jgi:hypothetical protein
MPFSMTLPGLPSGLGATIIQANAILLPAGDYIQLDWGQVQRIVNAAGPSMFPEIPRGAQPNPSWVFYTRTDMSGATASQKTIVGVKNRVIASNRKALNTSTMVYGEFPTKRNRIDVYAYHAVEATLSNGAKYADVSLSLAGSTVFSDPETQQLVVPTNGYQAIHEAMAFLLKPVAAGAPVWDPAYAAIAGVLPV